ncbi:hypothetical protein CYY_001581 [Polysphondylium violaceum]|uniref:Uncharacterized protein n=1 Tax=Polysphondylium violaceum TaxID=133409 RepID=A0A8J4Q1L7_9MYCE|nr:hypothetical protein CYY_001581 [Polysphondylium violaceum]
METNHKDINFLDSEFQQTLDKKKLQQLKSNADHICLLVKDYTFYKAERVIWYFKHLLSLSSNSCIKFNEKDQGIIVLYVQLENSRILDLYHYYKSLLDSSSFIPNLIKHHNSSEQQQQLLNQQQQQHQHHRNHKQYEVIEFDPQEMELPHVSVVPKTHISVVASKYKFVFSLDISPSMTSVDPITGRVLVDELISSLESILLTLPLPIEMSTSLPENTIQPLIYITVLAQGILPEHFRVLVQGAILSRKNVFCLIRDIKEQLHILENEIAHSIQTNDHFDRGVSDLSLTFSNCKTALSLLPSGACPHIIIMTDGVTNLPDSEYKTIENTVMLFNRNDISCSIVQIGSGAYALSDFGYPPNTDILRFLVLNTNGCFFDQSLIPKYQSQKDKLDVINMTNTSHLSETLYEKIRYIQHSLFFKDFLPNKQSHSSIVSSASSSNLLSMAANSSSSNLNTPTKPTLSRNNSFVGQQQHSGYGQFNSGNGNHHHHYQLSNLNTYPSRSTSHENTTVSSEVIVNNMSIIQNIMAIDYPFPWIGAPPTVPLLKTTAKEYNVEVDLLKLLDLRVREGFNVKMVSFKKPESELEINLYFQYLPNIKLEYRMNYMLMERKSSSSSNNNNLRDSSTSNTSGGSDYKSNVKVTISVMAYYEFLKEYTTGVSTGNSSSAKRQASQSVTYLQNFLSHIMDKDRLLSMIYTQCQPSSVPLPPSKDPIQTHQTISSSFLKLLGNLGSPEQWERWLKLENINALSKPSIIITPPTSDGATISPPQYTISFDSSRNALFKYMSRWALNSLSHSNGPYFVKFLPTTASPSFISPPLVPVSSGGSGDNLHANLYRHFPSSSFCVARVVWYMSGYFNINLYFFSTSESIREKTVRDMKKDLSDLSMLSNSFTEEYLNQGLGVSSDGNEESNVPISLIYPFERDIKSILIKYDFELINTISPRTSGTNVTTSSSSSSSTTTATATTTAPNSLSIPQAPPLPNQSMTSKTTTSGTSGNRPNVPSLSIAKDQQLQQQQQYDKSPPGSARNPLSNRSSNSNNNSSSGTNSNNSISMISNSNTIHSTSHSFHFHTAVPVLHNPNLKFYLWNHRWTYDLYDSKTCEQVLGFITQERLSEGFTLVNLNTYLFIKEIPLKNLDQKVVTTVQYLVYLRSPNCIVIEFWMEPQRGMYYSQKNNTTNNSSGSSNGSNSNSNNSNHHHHSNYKLNEKDLFLCLFKWFEESDQTIISSITTFNDLLSVCLSNNPENELTEALSPKNRPTLLFKEIDPSNQSTLLKIQCERPSFCLESVVKFATETQKLFPIVSVCPTESDGLLLIDKVQQGIQSNIKLHNLLAEIIKAMNLIEIPMSSFKESAKYKGGRCFVRGINNSDFVITYLHPHNLQSLSSSSADAGASKSFVVSFFECSMKGFIDVCHSEETTNFFDQLFDYQFKQKVASEASGGDDHHHSSFMVDNVDDPLHKFYTMKKNMFHETIHHTTPQHNSTRQYTRMVRATYDRAYIKSIYSNLKEKIPVDTKEFLDSVSSCKEYFVDIDITQFLRIMQKSRPKDAGNYIKSRFAPQVTTSFSKIEGTDYYFYDKVKIKEGTTGEDTTDATTGQSDSDEETSESNTEEDLSAGTNNSQTGTNSNSIGGDSLEKKLEQVLAEQVGQSTVDAKNDAIGMYPLPLFIKMEFVLYHSNPNYQSPLQDADEYTTNFPGIPMANGEQTYQYRFLADSLPDGPILSELAPIKSFLRFRCQALSPLSAKPMKTFSQGGSHSHSQSRPYGSATLKSHLPKYLWDVMRIHKKTVISILSAEILDCLRSIRPITKHILDLVIYHMNRLSSFKSIYHHLHTQVLNLIFVDSMEGASLFPEQMEAFSKMKFKRFPNDTFVYFEPKPSSAASHKPSLLKDVLENNTSNTTVTSAEPTNQQPSVLNLSSSTDELSGSTGVSPLASSTQIWICSHKEIGELKDMVIGPTNPAAATTVLQKDEEKEKAKEEDFVIPYWLVMFFNPSNNTLKIQFFSSVSIDAFNREQRQSKHSHSLSEDNTAVLASMSKNTSVVSPPTNILSTSMPLTRENTSSNLLSADQSKSLMSSPQTEMASKRQQQNLMNPLKVPPSSSPTPMSLFPSVVESPPHAIAGGGGLSTTPSLIPTAAVQPTLNIMNGIDTLSSSLDTFNNGKEICIHKYSPKREKAKIQISIAEIVRRVNQLILLNELDDLKSCSPLLLPPDDQSNNPSPNIASTTPSMNPTSGNSGGSGGNSSNSKQQQQLNLANKKINVKPTPKFYSPKEEDNNLYYLSGNIKKILPYQPGEFSCPLVHSMFLPLNDRLAPSVAIRGLTSAALHPFSVTNRKKMFVYRERGGNIFYMKLSEPVVNDSFPSNSTTPLQSPRQSPLQSPSTSPPKESYLSGGLPRSASIQSINAAQQHQFLVLEVYGIDLPTLEITTQLNQLLESRLASLTLSLISSLLLRNPMLKLTLQDVEFIKPPTSLPTSSVTIKLPYRISDYSLDPYLFLLFLKQNFLQFLTNLHLVSAQSPPSLGSMQTIHPPASSTPVITTPNSSSSSSVVVVASSGSGGLPPSLPVSVGKEDEQPPARNPLLSTSEILPNTSTFNPLSATTTTTTPAAAANNYEIKSNDYTFLYNFLSSNTSPQSSLSSIGNGIGFIVLSLLDQYSQVINSIPQTHVRKDNLTAEQRNLFIKDILKGVEIIENDLDSQQLLFPDQDPADAEQQQQQLQPPIWENKIQLKIWCKGSINVNLLIDKLVQSVNQALCEYTFETLLIPGTIPSLTVNTDYLEPSRQLFARGRALQAPSINEMKLNIQNLSTWATESFVSELNDMIIESNYKLPTTILFQNNVDFEDFITYNPIVKNLDENQDNSSNGSGSSNVHHNVIRNSNGISINLLNKNKYKFYIFAGKSISDPNQPISSTTTTNIQHQPVGIQVTSPTMNNSGGNTTDNNESLYTNEGLFYSHIKDHQLNSTLYRQCNLVASISSEHISIYTYNWSQSKLDYLSASLNRVQYWFILRRNLLNNILHQKMGLFNHVQPLNVNPFISSFFTEKLQNPIKFTFENIEPLTSQKPPKKGNPISNRATPSEDSKILLQSTSPRSKSKPNQQQQQVGGSTTLAPMSNSQPVGQFVNNSLINQPSNMTGTSAPTTATPTPTTTTTTTATTQSKKKTIYNSIPDFENLLKTHFPSPQIDIYYESKLPNIIDPVARYVGQVKKIANYVEKTSEAKRMFAQARSMFIDTDKTPSVAQLETIMKMSRLVHFRCVPFLYDNFKESQDQHQNAISPTLVGIVMAPKGTIDILPVLKYQSDGISSNSIHSPPLLANIITADASSSTSTSPSNNNNNVSPTTTSASSLPISANWKLVVMEGFISEYINYMEKVLHSNKIMITTSDPQSANNTPRDNNFGNNNSTNNNNNKQLKAYLQQNFKGGSLLIKIGFRELSVSCELFAIIQPNAVNRSSQSDSKPLTTLFAEEYGLFTHHLHLNSFVYDFHLRQLVLFLQGKQQQQQQQQQHKQLPPQYFIEMMYSMPKYYPKPPAHSFSHIYESTFSLPVPILPIELFNYVTQNVQAYNISNLNQCGVSPSIQFTVGPFIDPHSPNNTNIEYQWNVVVFCLNNNDLNSPKSDNNNDSNDDNSSNNQQQQQQHHNHYTIVDESKHQLKLQYFIIKTTNSTPFPRVDNLNHQNTSHNSNNNHQKSSIRSTNTNISNSPHHARSHSQFDINQINQAHNTVVQQPTTPNILIGSQASQSPSSFMLNSNQNNNNNNQHHHHQQQTNSSDFMSKSFRSMTMAEEVAKSKIYKIIIGASVNYQRDMLWLKLLKGNPYEPALSHQEFSHFMGFIKRRSLKSMDSSLVQPINLFSFMGNVWLGLSSHLVKTCGDRIRQLHNDPFHHLFILNPKADCLMLELVWNEKEKETDAFICRRDDQNISKELENELDEYELEHASQLVNTLCHYLWKQMLFSNK